jgi:hypothetical protein
VPCDGADTAGYGLTRSSSGAFGAKRSEKTAASEKIPGFPLSVAIRRRRSGKSSLRPLPPQLRLPVSVPCPREGPTDGRRAAGGGQPVQRTAAGQRRGGQRWLQGRGDEPTGGGRRAAPRRR